MEGFQFSAKRIAGENHAVLSLSTFGAIKC